MFKKIFKFMFIAMLAFSLVGFGVSTAFAEKPVNLASNNQSCHASENGKTNANMNSVLVAGDCVDFSRSGSGEGEGEGEGGTGGTDPVDPCLDPALFFFHPECW